MKPIINLEEKIGKTVGRRVPPKDVLNAARNSKEEKRAWRNAFPIGIPKGVYRFRTHEEADAWLMKMLTRPR